MQEAQLLQRGRATLSVIVEMLLRLQRNYTAWLSTLGTEHAYPHIIWSEYTRGEIRLHLTTVRLPRPRWWSICWHTSTCWPSLVNILVNMSPALFSFICSTYTQQYIRNVWRRQALEELTALPSEWRLARRRRSWRHEICMASFPENSSRKRSEWLVWVKDHSFTCHPDVYQRMEWAVLPLLSSCSASSHCGQYLFPVPRRVGGWVGLWGGWLHTEVLCMPEDGHPSLYRPTDSAAAEDRTHDHWVASPTP